MFDRAIDWAHQATDHAPGHQSLKAAEYWCDLLAGHRPAEQLAAREEVFRRWPSATTATRLHRAAGTSWQDYHDNVLATLAARPDESVLFSIGALIAGLRFTHRRRPRLQQEFDRAGPP